jgi:hypothetical protein
MIGSSTKVLPAGVPGCLKKRRFLNEQELSRALCQEYGEKFLELGWWEDALEFFQKGDYEPGLEKIKAHCLESGDAYLFGRLGRHSPELWRQVADQALKLGKLRFAHKALEQSGDKEQAEALARRINENGPTL